MSRHVSALTVSILDEQMLERPRRRQRVDWGDDEDEDMEEADDV